MLLWGLRILCWVRVLRDRVRDHAVETLAAFLAFRQLDPRKPEIVEALYHLLPLVEVIRFSEIRVGHQLIAALDISFILGACQNNYRDRLQVWVCFDARQNFTPMQFWQIQVQQDDIGARRIEIASLVLQKIHSLSTITHHVKTRGGIDFSQNLTHQPDVTLIVFDQQNIYRHRVPPQRLACAVASSDKWWKGPPVKDGTVLGRDSILIRALTKSRTANENEPM